MNEALKIHRKERHESIPQYAGVISATTLKWKIYVDDPGEKSIDISYSFQNETGKIKLKVRVADTHLTHSVVPTGKTVGEPNLNWTIDSFESHRMGRVNFPGPGYYEIELDIEPAKKEEVKFQWVWIR